MYEFLVIPYPPKTEVDVLKYCYKFAEAYENINTNVRTNVLAPAVAPTMSF